MSEGAVVLEYLVKLGGPGIVIVCLIYALKVSRQETKEAREETEKAREETRKCQEARLADLVAVTGEMKSALVTSTEVMRSNNSIQDRAGTSAASIARAVEAFKETIERFEERINDLFRVMGNK